MSTGLLLLRLVSEACQTSTSARVSIECHWSACTGNLIQCELCSVWFCCTCGNFSSQVVEVISTCKTLHWFCEPCDNVLNFPNFDPSIYKESIDNRLKSRVPTSFQITYALVESSFQNTKSVFKTQNQFSKQ